VTETYFRRATAGTAVLLLHLALLSALLFANYPRAASYNLAREIEIRFPPTVAKRSPTVLPALQPKFLSPTPPVLPVLPGQLFAPPEAAPAPGAISGVGRALFGCDTRALETLPPQDRAACLRLPQRKAPLANVRMPSPPDPKSPFTKEIDERFREARPINRPCPLGSFNDTHGLPCFGFQGEESLPTYPQQ
jgi:hypothetical protein